MNMQQTRDALAVELTRAAERHQRANPDAWPAFSFGSFCLSLSLALAAAQTPDELEALAKRVRQTLTA